MKYKKMINNICMQSIILIYTNNLYPNEMAFAFT